MTDKEQELLTEIIEFVKSLGYEQVWEKCPECNGEGGEITDGYLGYSCLTCKGTGKVRIQFKLPEGIEEELAKILLDCAIHFKNGDEERMYGGIKQILSLIRQDKE